MAIFIKNARYVITVDPQRRIIRDGGLLVEGDSVVRVGKTEEVARDVGGSADVIDAKNMVVSPGLVNCHFHTTQQLTRGLTEGTFTASSVARRWKHESSLTADDVYVAACAAMVEALKTGTTLLADPGGYYMERVVEAVEKVGGRAVLSRSMIDMYPEGSASSLKEGTSEALKAGEDFVKRFNGSAGGRVAGWFSVRTERSASNALVAGAKRLADQYGVGVLAHVVSGRGTMELHKELFHKTVIKRYAEAGALGPNFLALHANWVTDEEVELFKKFDVKVNHVPTSAFHGGNGGISVGKFLEMMEMGITVCLGHDSASAALYGDMLRVMSIVTAHRDRRLDPTVFPPETLLEMGTVNGARALLMEDKVGSLVAGKKADLVLWNVMRPDWIPVLNPVANLVLSASGYSADTVIVDGRVVVEGGRMKTVDEEEILAEAQQRAEAIADRADQRALAAPQWPIV